MVNIISTTALFPSGPTLALASIAVQNNLPLITRHPFYVDLCGMPICASYFPSPEVKFDDNRWSLLLDELLEQFLAEHSALLTHLPLRVWLVTPSMGRPGVPRGMPEQLMAQLTKYNIMPSHTTMIQGGHACAGIALAKIDSLQAQNTEVLDIVIAIDSWLPSESLMWLESKRLLHGSHWLYNMQPYMNPYGFIPSEGAVMILFSNHDSFTKQATLQTIAQTQEVNLCGQETPCTGEALTQAVHQVAKLSSQHLFERVITDLNGEPYRADEFGFTALRIQSYLAADYQHITPVLASGDTGCASLLLHLALASYDVSRMNNLSVGKSLSLILSGSDDGQRVALVVK